MPAKENVARGHELFVCIVQQRKESPATKGGRWVACCSLSRLFTMSPGLVLSVVVRFSCLLQCSWFLILVLLFFCRKNISFLDQFQFRRGIADQDGVHPTKHKTAQLKPNKVKVTDQLHVNVKCRPATIYPRPMLRAN